LLKGSKVTVSLTGLPSLVAPSTAPSGGS
jgi:hypothetical protein